MSNLTVHKGGREVILVMDCWDGHFADSLQIDILLDSQTEPTYSIQGVQGFHAATGEEVHEFPEVLRDELDELVELAWEEITGVNNE